MGVLYFPNKINTAISRLCIFNFFCCDFRLRVSMKRKRAAPYNGQSHLWQPDTHLSLQYKLQMWSDHYTWQSYRAVKKLTFYSPLPSGASCWLTDWQVDRLWYYLHRTCMKRKNMQLMFPAFPTPMFFLKSPSQRGKSPSLVLPQSPFQSCYVPNSHPILYIIKMCYCVVICLLYYKYRPF